MRIPRHLVALAVALTAAALLFPLIAAATTPIPQGTRIEPPSGAVWEVYCYGNGRTMAAVFEGLSMLLMGGTIGGLVKLAAFIGLVILIGYMAMGLAMGGFNRVYISPFTGLAMLGLAFFGFTARADIAVVDRNSSYYEVIQDVPFFIAAPAHIFSRMGDKLAEVVEQAILPVLTTEEELAFRMHGFGIGPATLQSTINVLPKDAEFLRALAVYTQECVKLDMESVYGTKRDWNVVFAAQDLDDLFGSELNWAEVTIDLDECPGISGVPTPCSIVWSSCLRPMLFADRGTVMDELEEEIADGLGLQPHEYRNILNEIAANFLGYTSVQANHLLAASVAASVMDRTLFQHQVGELAYGYAVYQGVTTWEAIGRFIRDLLPEIRTILEVLLYSFSIFVPFVFFFFRIRTLMTYLASILWIQLWPVAYVVGNFIALQKLLPLERITELYGVGLYALPVLHAQAQYALASSHLPVLLGIMVLGGVVYGGEYALIRGVVQATGHLSATATQAAGEAAAVERVAARAGVWQRAMYQSQLTGEPVATGGIAEMAARAAFFEPKPYSFSDPVLGAGEIVHRLGTSRVTTAYGTWEWSREAGGGRGRVAEVGWIGHGEESTLTHFSATAASQRLSEQYGEAWLQRQAEEVQRVREARRAYQRETTVGLQQTALLLMGTYLRSQRATEAATVEPFARALHEQWGRDQEYARAFAEEFHKAHRIYAGLDLDSAGTLLGKAAGRYFLGLRVKGGYGYSAQAGSTDDRRFTERALEALREDKNYQERLQSIMRYISGQEVTRQDVRQFTEQVSRIERAEQAYQERKQEAVSQIRGMVSEVAERLQTDQNAAMARVQQIYGERYAGLVAGGHMTQAAAWERAARDWYGEVTRGLEARVERLKEGRADLEMAVPAALVAAQGLEGEVRAEVAARGLEAGERAPAVAAQGDRVAEKGAEGLAPPPGYTRMRGEVQAGMAERQAGVEEGQAELGKKRERAQSDKERLTEDKKFRKQEIEEDKKRRTLEGFNRQGVVKT